MSVELLPTIAVCSDSHFELVKQYINDFELDDRCLVQEEFLTLLENDVLIGFGRIREFETLSELCSLGIIPHYRKNGLGRILCKALIQKAKKPLYLVCIIPAFFENLGFRICDSFPVEIEEKLNYCTSTLIVQENYVAMKKQIVL